MPHMRFAPPNPLRIADRATGLNAVSVRSYNERLFLSLLLQKKAATRPEIGERTGLSAKTVSVLVRALEQEGLVAKGEAQRGRMGPPTVPISLNPEGAFSIGISVGNRDIDFVLIDFVGEVRFHATLPTSRLQSRIQMHGFADRCSVCRPSAADVHVLPELRSSGSRKGGHHQSRCLIGSSSG